MGGGHRGSGNHRVLGLLGVVSTPALQLHLDVVELPRGLGARPAEIKVEDPRGASAAGQWHREAAVATEGSPGAGGLLQWGLVLLAIRETIGGGCEPIPRVSVIPSLLPQLLGVALPHRGQGGQVLIVQQGSPAVGKAIPAWLLWAQSPAGPWPQPPADILIGTLGLGRALGRALIVVVVRGFAQAGAEALALHHVPPSRGWTQHEFHLAWLQEHLWVLVVGTTGLCRQGCSTLRQGLQAVPAPEVVILTGWRVDISVGLGREEESGLSRSVQGQGEKREQKGQGENKKHRGRELGFLLFLFL